MRKFPKRNIHIYADEIRKILILACSGGLIRGKQINEFERSLAEFIGCKYAIAAGSGRFALSLILKGLGLTAGDEVLLSAYNYPGVAAMLIKEGFRVTLVDVGSDSFQMDVRKMEEKVTRSTRAVIATHLFGQPCNIRGISTVAGKHGLRVIEDAAHSLGTTICGLHTGKFSDAGLLSFSGSKPVNTSYGGMVLTDNPELYESIISQVNNLPFPDLCSLFKMRLFTYLYSLFTNSAFYGIIGYPLSLALAVLACDPWEIYNHLPHKEFADKQVRFTNMQACMGLGYMNDLPAMLARRRKYAERIYNIIKENIFVQESSFIQQAETNSFMIPLRARNKLKVYKKLLLKGIDSNLGYAYDCSYLTKSVNPNAGSFDKSLLLINLPFFMREKEVEYLAAAINSVSADLLSVG